MANISWDEARKCPKCSEPGDVTASHRVHNGDVKTLICRNKRCVWFETTWIVQVDSAGSVPVRPQGPKEYPAMTPGMAAYARRTLEDIAAEDESGEQLRILKQIEDNSNI